MKKAKNINTSKPVLYDYQTREAIRNATPDELAESQEAARRDGGAGVIRVEGHDCYVLE